MAIALALESTAIIGAGAVSKDATGLFRQKPSVSLPTLRPRSHLNRHRRDMDKLSSVRLRPLDVHT
jgi:hypothetical protein